ncbi:MAG: hypothetical protein AAGU75_18175 [Bacillota bacterium]
MPECFEIGALIGGFMIIPPSAFAQVVFPDVGLPANGKAFPWPAAQIAIKCELIRTSCGFIRHLPGYRLQHICFTLTSVLLLY